MKINLEKEKKTTEHLADHFTHPTIQTQEQNQIVQTALKLVGPKPDFVHTDFVTLCLSQHFPDSGVQLLSSFCTRLQS